VHAGSGPARTRRKDRDDDQIDVVCTEAVALSVEPVKE
jgi:hypothetical protein